MADVARIPDPNSNRMFREDMGACNSGCKCQTEWRITVDGGGVVEHDRETGHPCHLRALKPLLDDGEVVERDGKYLYQLPHPFTIEGEEPITEQEMDVVTVDGELAYRDPCAVLEFDTYAFEDEAKKLADGDYIVTQEYACFTTYHYECGEEGDSDAVYEVTPAPPDETDSPDAPEGGLMDAPDR